jgi:hypothetical protein
VKTQIKRLRFLRGLDTHTLDFPTACRASLLLTGGGTARRSVPRVVQPLPGHVVAHVFGDDRVVDAQAARLARLVDAGFVAECGWMSLVRSWHHPLIIRGWSGRSRPARCPARRRVRCRAVSAAPDRTACAGHTAVVSCFAGCRFRSSSPPRHVAFLPGSASARWQHARETGAAVRSPPARRTRLDGSGTAGPSLSWMNCGGVRPLRRSWSPARSAWPACRR